MTANDQARVTNILDHLAEEKRPCLGCGRLLWFCRSRKTGKLIPLTDALTNHFQDCPNRDQFRKPRQPAPRLFDPGHPLPD